MRPEATSPTSPSPSRLLPCSSARRVLSTAARIASRSPAVRALTPAASRGGAAPRSLAEARARGRTHGDSGAHTALGRLGAAGMPLGALVACQRRDAAELPAVPGTQWAPAVAMPKPADPTVADDDPSPPAASGVTAHPPGEDELLAEGLDRLPGQHVDGLRASDHGREDVRPPAHRSGLSGSPRPSTSTSTRPSSSLAIVILVGAGPRRKPGPLGVRAFPSSLAARFKIVLLGGHDGTSSRFFEERLHPGAVADLRDSAADADRALNGHPAARCKSSSACLALTAPPARTSANGADRSGTRACRPRPASRNAAA